MEKSRIRDKHPGSATLYVRYVTDEYCTKRYGTYVTVLG
jgi:hypothetical protein